EILAVDLSDPASSKKIFDRLKEKKLEVSILLNNAGYGIWDHFDALTLDDQRAMMVVNIGATVNLTTLFIPELKKNKPSYVLNVASTTCYQPIAGFNVYAACK